MGFNTISGSITQKASSNSAEEVASNYNNILPVKGLNSQQTFPDNEAVTDYGCQHLLRAHITLPSVMRFSHNYTSLGIYNVTLNATNDVTSDNIAAASAIHIQEEVTDVVLVCASASMFFASILKSFQFRS